jgi:hypothetical protein
MCTIHGLKVGLWIPKSTWFQQAATQHSPPFIPIAIIKNDDIGRHKVDTQAARSRCEQENKLLAPRPVVLVDGIDPILVRGATVDPTVS